VPTIGVLFLLSFIGATAVGVALLTPRRIMSPRVADIVHTAAALGAIGIAAGTLVSLLVSEYTPRFGS
jgi:hypothetical protein